MSFRKLCLHVWVAVVFALITAPAQAQESNDAGKRLRRPPKQTAPPDTPAAQQAIAPNVPAASVPAMNMAMNTAMNPTMNGPAVNAPRAVTGSLFSDGAPGGNLFGDFKARNIGDLVFIDVIETSNASVSSNAKRSRDSGNVGGLTPLIGSLSFPSAATAVDVITAMGTRKYEGTGETGRKSTLSARVTGRVIEVLPNGDLRVVAQKTVRINKENELLTLSGLVRRRDVGADNAIPTTMVGELQVMLNGKGVASADNAPGWLYRLFDKFSPF